MSDYVNHVREAESESERKPTYKAIAIVAVREENIDEFDKLMLGLNNRWAGAMLQNVNGVFFGWMSYTARGANMHDITRRFGGLADVLSLVERVYVMEGEE